MDVLAQIFDVSLLATIGLIFLITLVGAYLRSSRRDPCLKSFEHYHITMECVDGKVAWGGWSWSQRGSNASNATRCRTRIIWSRPM